MIPEASGHGLVDQGYTGPWNTGSAPFGAISFGTGPTVQPAGQTFTPTASELTGVDIFLADFDPQDLSDTYTITIWKDFQSSSNLGTMVGSISKVVTDSGETDDNNPFVAHFHFNNPIPLEAGTLYFIQVESGTILFWLARNFDPY